jgi:hypothetical protein
MRIIYNPDFIFKGIPKEKQKRYYERILHFVRAPDDL